MPDVDATLDTVKAFERRERIVPVEPDIPREVVAGPIGDADERHVALDGDSGDRRERAVAARHAEHVRLRRPRDVLEVLAVLEDVDVDSARPGSLAQLSCCRRVGSGARVDDEEALHSCVSEAKKMGQWGPEDRPSGPCTQPTHSRSFAA
jgi:hypothetical protein